MKRLNGRILYRLPIAVYLSLAVSGFFFFPFGVIVAISKEGELKAVIISLIINFVPCLLLAIIISVITIFLRLRHSSYNRRRLAIGFSIFSASVVIGSIVSLLRFTSLRWEGTYPNTGSMDGGPEWIIGWMGSCASGLLVLFLNYLFLIRRIKSTSSE